MKQEKESTVQVLIDTCIKVQHIIIEDFEINKL